MEKSYWYGSLLTLAAALFVFNGAKHMQGYRLQQQMGGRGQHQRALWQGL
jgi:hypothetical protein